MVSLWSYGVDRGIDMEPTVKVDSDGNKSWWINGQLHRTDGPALEYADGSKFWYLNGEKMDESTYLYLTGVKDW